MSVKNSNQEGIEARALKSTSSSDPSLQPQPPEDYIPAEAEQLTTEGENWEPHFSPDGRKILFLSQDRIRHLQSQVYELNRENRQQRRVTFHDGDDFSPHYDLSGEYVLYSSTTDEIKEDPEFIQKSLSLIASRALPEEANGSTTTGQEIDKSFPHPTPYWINRPFEIYRSTILGNKIVRLTLSKNFDAEASYHPSHPSIVFTSTRSGRAQIYVMSVNGKSVNRLSKEKYVELEARFDPSGHGLTFVRYSADLKSSQILYQDLKNKKVVSLGQNSSLQRSPVWHPDGQWIIFSSNQDDENNFELYTVRKDGNCLQRLTYALGQDSYPTLSPDGKILAFSSDRKGRPQLFQMEYRPPSTCAPPNS